MSVIQLTEHLKRRQFAPVLDEISPLQRNCVRALKLMCIVDHRIEIDGLYNHLKNEFLMTKLMKFDYCLFKYYEYQQLERTRDCLLACRDCNLVAEYNDMLTHMAVTHSTHVGLKWCAYCNVTELGAHTRESFEQCKESYYKMYDIKVDLKHYVVHLFNVALKKVAEEIGVVVKRNRWYGGYAQTEIEALIKLHGHAFPQLSVGFAANCKKIDDVKFFDSFNFVATVLRILTVEPESQNDCVIVESTDDDVSDGETTNARKSNELMAPVQLQVVGSQSDVQMPNELEGNEVVNADTVSNLNKFVLFNDKICMFIF